MPYLIIDDEDDRLCYTTVGHFDVQYIVSERISSLVFRNAVHRNGRCSQGTSSKSIDTSYIPDLLSARAIAFIP